MPLPESPASIMQILVETYWDTRTKMDALRPDSILDEAEKRRTAAEFAYDMLCKTLVAESDRDGLASLERAGGREGVVDTLLRYLEEN